MRPVASAALLNLEQHVGSDGVHVEVSGEIDAFTGPYLAEAVTAAVRAGAAHVDLDLGDVSFLDSSGIRGLLAARDTAHGALRMTGMSDAVRRVLEVSGLAGQFERAPHTDSSA